MNVKPGHPMEWALEEAVAAASRGEVPVGAVVVGPDGRCLGKAGNRVLEKKDPAAHAEILALRAAGREQGNERLTGCDLYVTLEPCTMCAGAISMARIRRIYFGASDPKGGGVENGVRFFEHPSCHHKPEVYGGFLETASARLLRRFFEEKRY